MRNSWKYVTSKQVKILGKLVIYLGHGRHLGDDGQVVDDEANLIFLVASQGLSVTCKKIVKLQKIEPNGFTNFRKLATYCLSKN